MNYKHFMVTQKSIPDTQELEGGGSINPVI